MMKKNVPVISPPCLKKNAQNSHRPALLLWGGDQFWTEPVRSLSASNP
ncbi:hypothetical protein EK98_000393 [Salmonella enterica subsp. salamae]|nr:hypothetical protein [Salmonella enterica subsp. salamae]